MWPMFTFKPPSVDKTLYTSCFAGQKVMVRLHTLSRWLPKHKGFAQRYVRESCYGFRVTSEVTSSIQYKDYSFCLDTDCWCYLRKATTFWNWSWVLLYISYIYTGLKRLPNSNNPKVYNFVQYASLWSSAFSWYCLHASICYKLFEIEKCAKIKYSNHESRTCLEVDTLPICKDSFFNTRKQNWSHSIGFEYFSNLVLTFLSVNN